MLEVVVIAKHLEADDIISLELASTNGGELPDFEAGAHVDVHLPNGMIRQYSLCYPPGKKGHYLLGILRDSESRGGSILLHDQIEVNERLQISEPRNLFPLTTDASRTLLFAGGIGITPIWSMAEALAKADADFELHYSGHSRSRMAFVDQLLNSAYAERVHLHISDLTPPQRLDADPLLANPQPDTHLYVCGPARFIDYVLNRATAHGWSPDQLHREYFAATEASEAEDGSFEVEIKSSGQVFEVPADLSVLHVLEDAGIDIPVSCEEGVCGTCLTRVLEGEPEHRDMFLNEEERARNDQFTPCCSRAKGRLVLDL